MEQKRIDTVMVERGIASSREKAKAMIKSGDVYLNSQRVSKAGLLVGECDIIEFRGTPELFVSRGGLKLQKALEVFGIDLRELMCLDVGASTGGFTDCMLKSGARGVYAVDSGTAQLAQPLLEDSRVVNLEKTNFRFITENELPEAVDFAGVDVSFISLQIILPVLFNFLKPCGSAVCLIKPQFEAGRGNLNKKGVVKNARVHERVITDILVFAQGVGFLPAGLDFSPVKGPQGNIEYLLYLKMSGDAPAAIDIRAVVEASHRMLDGGERH